METKEQYGSNQIEILEGLEAVRKRPGMYIGSTGKKGLHHLVYEIVDNSIDEALAGFATRVDVEILKDNYIRVKDDGRGIPVDIHPKTNKTTVETVLTVLHAGGKFNNDAYKVSGGLHGVGASVVNALSSYLKVEVFRDGFYYYQEYSIGKPTIELKKEPSNLSNGTIITFKPDVDIFKETTEFEYDILKQRLQQLAFLNKGLIITLKDQRQEQPIEDTFVYSGGLLEYVNFLNKGKETLNKEPIYIEKTENDINVEIALLYNNEFKANIFSFANNIATPEGGMHEDGFKMALSRIINRYGNNNNLFKKAEQITGEDTREGLVCVISVKLKQPEFEGQTKSKLGNPEVKPLVSNIFGEQLERYLMENPQEAKLIIEKIILASNARNAARKAREATRRKSPLDTLGFASKLSDCRTKNADIAELFIVEGDSAGGSAKQGRDSKIQAILPLRGKVLNVEKAREDKVYANNELKSLIMALGCGIGDEFDASKTRYKKIVIMTDADVDGAHIRTLLLTFFFRYMKDIIQKGYLYIAQPPLFKISSGKKIKYVYTDQELEKELKELNDQRYNLQRYKGLGEMNPEQLWETTMDPEKRTLLKVELEDAIEANLIFEQLMGEDSEPRKDFISKNAQYVKNLDI